MLFHTVPYWLFFLTVTMVFYSIPYTAGKWWLLLASCAFYMSWNPYFILLLASIIIIDYGAAFLIDQAVGARRKMWLCVSVVANLGILAFFKYYNFFAGIAATVAGKPEDAWLLNIILPLGISFHTFQSMSYTIDIYFAKSKPVRSFLDFSLFVVFFPQLVAGPIVRARDFFPELAQWKKPAVETVTSGVWLAALGLIKKAVLADSFAVISDRYFNGVQSHPGAAAAMAGTLSFAMQIFFDFSGYTDVARGCARILGFEFPLNFARPYLSRNIAEFWRRWHISLSSWLRDYLYIPLGGNRFGTFKTYRNLFITMVLGGFWHGASWNFIIWGAYQGVLLAMHRAFCGVIENTAAARILAWRIFIPIKVACTFAFVCIGWIPFRAVTLSDTAFVLRQLFSRLQLVQTYQIFSVGLIIAFVAATVLAILEERYQWVAQLARLTPRTQVAALSACLLLLEFFAYTERAVPFIYFQF